MSILNFWKRKRSLRKSKYFVTFDRNEELPLCVWEYLVKRRAGFKCEICGSTPKLISHHIKFRPEGKNILRNGTCLCPKCHGKAHTIVVPRKSIMRIIMQAIGKRKYKTFIIEIKEEIKNWVDEDTDLSYLLHRNRKK